MFHITKEGPKPCSARVSPCPFLESLQHFATEKEAQQAFEALMESYGMTLAATASRRFTMSLTPATERLVRSLKAQGLTPYLVGGAVRDQFLGMDNKDVDIEVYGADPQGESYTLESLASSLRQDGYKVDLTGASFAVLKVRWGGEEFDIAFPRTEQSTGDGHREYEVAYDSRLPFAEASARRDFTINALAYDPITGRLTDPHGGENDLKQRVLRHISPAFSDDPLRVLRAVNFASRFELQVAPETLELCRSLRPAYASLPVERVQGEFAKVFSKGIACERALEVLHDTTWAEVMPPFQGVPRETLTAWGKRLNLAPRGLMREAALEIILARNGRPSALPLVEPSHARRTFASRAQTLADALSRGSIPEVVAAHRTLRQRHPEVPTEAIRRIMVAAEVPTDLMRNLPETPRPPVITGDALLARGFRSGPELGALLKRAQYIQDAEGLLDFDALLSRALRG